MKVLIVGAGRWGSILIRKFSAQLGPENVLVCDKDVTRIPAKVFGGGPDYLPLFPYVDAVVVATQPAQHYMVAADALDARKHVLVEKPLAMRGREARDLYGRALSRGLTLMTDDTHQYHPDMARFLEEAKGTRYLMASWSNEKVSQAEDSILWVNGPHPVSIILAAMGKPERILARTAEDDADITFEWTDGRVAKVRMSWRGDFHGRRTRLVLTDRAEFDGDRKYEGPDPLDRMCAAFIARCQAPWQDARGVQVAELLERIEKVAL